MSNNLVDNRVPDNYFMDFPAKMQDGRLFTDYKSACVMNAQSLGMTSFEYRNYLTHNGSKILNNNTKIVNEIAGCRKCGAYSVFPPYLAIECNEDQCIQKINSPDGVGAEVKTHLSNNRKKKIEYIKSTLDNNKSGFSFSY